MPMLPSDFEGLWKTLPTDDPSAVDWLRKAGLKDAVNQQIVRFANGRTGDPWLDEKATEGYRIVFPLRDGLGATVGLLVRHPRPRSDGPPAYLVAPGTKPGAILGHPNRTVSSSPIYVTVEPLDVLALQVAAVPVVGCYAPEQLSGLIAYMGTLHGKVVYLCSVVAAVSSGAADASQALAELGEQLEEKGAVTRILTPQGGARTIAETARTMGPKQFSRFLLTGRPPRTSSSTESRGGATRPMRSPGGAAPEYAPDALPEGELAEPPPQTAPTLAPLDAKARPLTKSFGSMCQILRTPALRRAVLGEGEIEFNEQSLQATIGRKTVIDDFAVNRIRELAERRFEVKPGSRTGLQFAKGDIEQSVSLVSREKIYHPVADYLRGLTSDGNERLNSVAEDILGVQDEELVLEDGSKTRLLTVCSLLLRKWMISAVARALKPGEKVDTVLILTGPQGAWKSRFFKTLLPDESWFTDTPIDIRSKDSYMVMRRVWILEWPELVTMTRARDGEAVKAFVSSASDTFRPPYEREVRSVPRTSVIAGSTNKKDFLVDETGNRRWWPVPVAGEIRLDLLREQRDQLWAEAVRAFREGEPHWLTRSEEAALVALQKRYEDRDAWEDRVLSHIRHETYTTVSQILSDAIDKPAGQWTSNDEKRITKILRRNGFDNKQIQVDGVRRWRWFRTESAEELTPRETPEPPPQTDADAPMVASSVQADLSLPDG